MIKRVIYLHFDRVIPREMMNTNLLFEILQEELPSIIYKALRLYKEYIDTHPTNQIFENNRPEYFLGVNALYDSEMNNIGKFLNQEEFVYNGTRYYTEFSENVFTPWTEFEHKYKIFCKNKNIHHTQISADDTIFQRRQLTKV